MPSFKHGEVEVAFLDEGAGELVAVGRPANHRDALWRPPEQILDRGGGTASLCGLVFAFTGSHNFQRTVDQWPL